MNITDDELYILLDAMVAYQRQQLNNLRPLREAGDEAGLNAQHAVVNPLQPLLSKLEMVKIKRYFARKDAADRSSDELDAEVKLARENLLQTDEELRGLLDKAAELMYCASNLIAVGKDEAGTLYTIDSDTSEAAGELAPLMLSEGIATGCREMSHKFQRLLSPGMPEEDDNAGK